MLFTSYKSALSESVTKRAGVFFLNPIFLLSSVLNHTDFSCFLVSPPLVFTWTAVVKNHDCYVIPSGFSVFGQSLLSHTDCFVCVCLHTLAFHLSAAKRRERKKLGCLIACVLLCVCICLWVCIICVGACAWGWVCNAKNSSVGHSDREIQYAAGSWLTGWTLY